jgi:CRP/FNR family transcriptional regulator, anaerobic regulatory protein
MATNLSAKMADGGAHSNPCTQCSVRHRAICSAVDFDRIGDLHAIVSHRDIAAGTAIFDEGDGAGIVYNISAGEVRLFKLLPDGRRQITGFLRAGDFLGLSCHGTYTYSAEAVTNVSLCIFRIGDLDKLFLTFPRVRERLLEKANDELAVAQEQMLLLGRKTAREKLLSFLLARARHEGDDGYDQEIHVPMTRMDIADYLGLTVETVSRTFTMLRDDGLIRTPTPNRVELADIDRIEEIARAF